MLCILQVILGACSWWTFEEAPLEYLVRTSSGFYFIMLFYLLALAWHTGSIGLIVVCTFVACYGGILRYNRVSPIVRQVSGILGLCLATTGGYHVLAMSDALSLVFVYRSTVNRDPVCGVANSFAICRASTQSMRCLCGRHHKFATPISKPIGFPNSHETPNSIFFPS